MCVNFTTPVDLNGPKKVSEKAKETFWPILSSHIDEGEIDFKDLALDCDICFQGITVFPKNHVYDEDGDSHRGEILPCGHIFGASCISQLAIVNTESGYNLCCPKCRADFAHPKCGHHMSAVYLPSNKPDMDMIPLTTNKGGQIARRCHFCMIEKVLKHINKELHMHIHEDIKERIVASITIGEDTYYPIPTNGDLEEIYAPESFRIYAAKYSQYLENLEGCTKIWYASLVGGFQMKLHDINLKAKRCG
ncbi:hypothetical protein IL306_002382 [Fusarium sp. DS 682]|nr:hypothetical protein IL306_002382 [Fusarium sp. DS 682]